MPTLPRAVALAALAAAPVSARAEGFLDSGSRSSTFLSASWEVAVPGGALRDFVEKGSLRGMQFELAFGVARHLSLGLSGSWNWLAQGFSQGSLSLPDGDITGPAYRRVQLIRLMATGHWVLASGPLQPYVGLGVGGGWHDSYLAVADVVRTASGWHAAGEPRAGLLLTVGPGLAVYLQARYALTTARIGDAKDARWLAVSLGLAAY